MGNSIGIVSEDDEPFDITEDGFGYNVINFTVNTMDVHFRAQNNHPNNLPVCEKPNVDKFRVSMKFKISSFALVTNTWHIADNRHVQRGKGTQQPGQQTHRTALESDAGTATAGKWPRLAWQRLVLTQSTALLLQHVYTQS